MWPAQRVGGGSRLLNGPPEVLRHHEVAAIASWGTPLDRILCWRRLSGRRAMIATHHLELWHESNSVPWHLILHILHGFGQFVTDSRTELVQALYAPLLGWDWRASSPAE